MLGTKRLEADFVYAATPNTFTAALDAGDGEGLLELGIFVEEDDMFVELECRVLMDIGADDTVNCTLFVDGVDVETVGTAGLVQAVLLTATDASTIVVRKTVALAKGQHVIDFRMLTAGAGVPTLAGATIPCELTARKISNYATLGHGVDSKVQLAQ